MTRTPLTAEQYSELVVTLEAMRAEYVAGNEYGIERTLRCHWLAGHLSPFAFIYLLHWFYLIDPWLTPGTDYTPNIAWACDNMVAELCRERC